MRIEVCGGNPICRSIDVDDTERPLFAHGPGFLIISESAYEVSYRVQSTMRAGSKSISWIVLGLVTGAL